MTWTVRAEDARILESFHVKCQRQILGIRWQDHVRNAEVTIQTGLPSVIDHVVIRRNAIFGHIARMPSNVPVHQVLSCQVDLSLGRPPDRSWKRHPGRHPKWWLDQICDNSQCPPADVWRDADAVIVERRNGPQRLRANDDDDNIHHIVHWKQTCYSYLVISSPWASTTWPPKTTHLQQVAVV